VTEKEPPPKKRAEGTREEAEGVADRGELEDAAPEGTVEEEQQTGDGPLKESGPSEPTPGRTVSPAEPGREGDGGI
jgi:hypothetical protein